MPCIIMDGRHASGQQLTGRHWGAGWIEAFGLLPLLRSIVYA